ncbi:MAG: DUF1343 domain-containing protein [Candidatus Aminicenantes bacterium]|nr:DUF1343 domain-containing protein [Candidatus Aminicenantes bacterium]
MKFREPRIRSIVSLALLAAAATIGVSCKPDASEPPAGADTVAASVPARVKPGIEVLLEKRLDLIRGKRVGLITNPSGADAGLRSSIDLLRAAPGVELVALYGPEHGVRGDAQAGEYVPFYKDASSGLPVFSLYGPSMKPPAGMLVAIDEYMRSFDTTHKDKKIEPTMTKGVDVLLFDVQDVGTRVYTYQATMAYAMQACAESGLEFIVLDRPNPIDGATMEGPVLEYPKHSSFVGLYPYPLRFGMTLGELARLFNDKFLEKKCRLTVVPMEGWHRNEYFETAGLPWVPPSPNMPTVDTAVVYPGQVFLEGTNVSEGRGTTKPFEFFGAPWVDGHKLAVRLNALGLAGVAFREQWFTPIFSKFKGELCGGCQIHVTDRKAYRPLETTLQILAVLRQLYPKDFAFHAAYFDKIMGTDKVRLALEKGTPVSEIAAAWKPELAVFEALRKPYLLY